MANDLVALLEKKKGSLAAILPKHMTAERMIKIALVSASRQPDLLQCTPASVLQALMIASQIGLEPGGAFGHCHLVPFYNDTIKKKEATFIAGFKGLIELARRSGQITNIEAHVVHEKDEFFVRYGTDPLLRHQPALIADPGPVIAVYAVAIPKDGKPQFDVMTKAQVDKIRAGSKLKDGAPWKNHYEEMARKTVIKRLCKYLPMSSELAIAIEADSRAEADEKMDLSDLVDISGVIEEEKKTDDLKEPGRASEKVSTGDPKQESLIPAGQVDPKAALMKQIAEIRSKIGEESYYNILGSYGCEAPEEAGTAGKLELIYREMTEKLSKKK